MAALGDVSVLIANAGVNGPTKPLWDYSLAEWNQVIDVEFAGICEDVPRIRTQPTA